MDSRAWLAHLEQFGIKLGLDTITAIAGALGHPERACPVLHVAGTNGKGSVSAMAGHALTSSGLVTARYTSPHLVRLEERFAVDGLELAVTQVVVALEERADDPTRDVSVDEALGIRPFPGHPARSGIQPFRKASERCATKRPLRT